MEPPRRTHRRRRSGCTKPPCGRLPSRRALRRVAWPLPSCPFALRRRRFWPEALARLRAGVRLNPLADAPSSPTCASSPAPTASRKPRSRARPSPRLGLGLTAAPSPKAPSRRPPRAARFLPDGARPAPCGCVHRPARGRRWGGGDRCIAHRPGRHGGVPPLCEDDDVPKGFLPPAASRGRLWLRGCYTAGRASGARRTSFVFVEETSAPNDPMRPRGSPFCSGGIFFEVAPAGSPPARQPVLIIRDAAPFRDRPAERRARHNRVAPAG